MKLSGLGIRIAGKITLIVAAAGLVAANSPMTFAQTVQLTSITSGNNHNDSGHSKFELTDFTANAVKGSARTFNLNVTVTQTSADGSSTEHHSHSFPRTLYLQVINSSGQLVTPAPLSATLITPGDPDISYPSGHKGSVSATVTYQLVVPSSTALTPHDTLRIFSPPAKNKKSTNAQYTFRMGLKNDPSWSDDVVSGTGSAANSLPTGQLPEVPLAVGLPLIGLGAATVIWMRRPRSRVFIR